MCSKGLWGVRSLLIAAAVGIIGRARLPLRVHCKVLMAWVMGLFSFYSGFQLVWPAAGVYVPCYTAFPASYLCFRPPLFYHCRSPGSMWERTGS